jgi:large subunit ribosomal protein L22
MPGPKTNEAPRRARSGRPQPEQLGTRAVLRHSRIAPNKVREVLDLIRDRPVHEAEDILRFSERDAALVVGKVLHSAVANAENNNELDPDELYVSACFADEGTTIKRWRPRARGRATRIRKRTSHITVIVSRLPEDRLERLRAHRRAEQLAQRARRVRSSRVEGDTRSRAERRRRGGSEEETVEQDAIEQDAIEQDAGAAALDAPVDSAEAPAGSQEALESEAPAESQEALESEAPAVSEATAGSEAIAAGDPGSHDGDETAGEDE